VEFEVRHALWQQNLTGALDRLRACVSDEERWTCGVSLLRDCGSQWITVGTAPRNRLTDVVVRSTTPDDLMHDYQSQRFYRDDPWMRLCADGAPVDFLDTRTPETAGPLPRSRIAQLFADHGVRRAALVPCYGGRRTGGIVLYDRNTAADNWTVDPQGLERARLLIAIFAAFYRPEADRTQTAELYRIGAALTAREREVLAWLWSGHQTARIADRMGIEPVTVTKHLASIRRKLGARTREQALAIAMLEGLIAI
jgi:DNA-binding CsgD family transcriptional regulator